MKKVRGYMQDHDVLIRELAFILKKQHDSNLPLDIDFSRAVLSDINNQLIDEVQFQVIAASLADLGILEPVIPQSYQLYFNEGWLD